MATISDSLRLLAWLSPSFPTGAFAYSHGLEWAVEVGDVCDAESLRLWIEDVLRHGAGRSDAILLRQAHAGEDVAELGRAAQASRERLGETVGQGEAFVRAAAAWRQDPHPGPKGQGEASSLSLWERARMRETSLPYYVALGMIGGRLGIDADALCAGFLQAFAANLISAAVRLVPLGQSAGLSVLAALEPVIVEVMEQTRGVGMDDLGGCAWRSDIAAMRHETQYTRLFRS